MLISSGGVSRPSTTAGGRGGGGGAVGASGSSGGRFSSSASSSSSLALIRGEPQVKRRQIETSSCTVDAGEYQLFASSYGDKGLRKQMEDEHLLLPSLLPLQPHLSPSYDFALFGVFDGHGGRQSAAFVKEVLPAELAAQLLLLQEEEEKRRDKKTEQTEREEEEEEEMKKEEEEEKKENHVMAKEEEGETEKQTNHPDGERERKRRRSDSAREEEEISESPDVKKKESDAKGQSRKDWRFSDRDIRKVLYNACRKVDARIATEIPSCRDGCTAVMVLVHIGGGRSGQVYVAGLGDSAAYLARRKDKNTLHSIPLTEVHRHWVIEEKERIAKMGGTIENGRVNGSLEVTRSFGDIPLKRYGVSCIPTVKKFCLDENSDEFLLIGCDGFWNCWTARDAIHFAAQLWDKEVRSSKVHSRPVDPQNVCKQLVGLFLLKKWGTEWDEIDPLLSLPHISLSLNLSLSLLKSSFLLPSDRVFLFGRFNHARTELDVFVPSSFLIPSLLFSLVLFVREKGRKRLFLHACTDKWIGGSLEQKTSGGLSLFHS
ncbi:protein phosphatase 2c domain-containing protein [Cystoisospora suis]|uniref:protein-serine/threonine phosphatase n=1 Tax=Cystoisospora suis TaxID=483139 RepID=A0A2C6KMQ3_9APIC|nr:protein phosphatase 2c domain-containing protein [Cystoisospora suis]